MLTDANLKVKTVKNNKFHENFFWNILNPLMPKIPKWFDTFSNLAVNDVASDNKS